MPEPSANFSPPRPWLRPELVASWGEIAGVLLVLLVPFIVMSALGATRGSQHHFLQTFLSNRTLSINGAGEASILGLGLIYLHRRGWKPADLHIRPGFLSSCQGVALVPLSLVVNGVVVFASLGVLFHLQHSESSFPRFVVRQSPQMTHLHAGHLSWVVLAAAMVLNAYLEEIVCTSYAFTQFAAKRGPLFALALTVLLRMACHTYQGPVHALGIGAVFLVYGLWYWWTRNVWTLIAAHALLDFGTASLVKVLFP